MNGEIWEQENQDILKSAEFNGFSVLKHAQKNDSEFHTEKQKTSWMFISNGVLYYYMSSRFRDVASFSRVNMSREDVVSGNKGVYFQVV